MRHTKFYEVWKGMKSRCNNKKHRWYHNYGGKGITVCDEWLVFDAFYADMYESYIAHQKGNNGDTTLERVRNDLGYSRGNCRWATRKEQANNFSARNIRIEYRGKNRTIAQWALIRGINYMTLRNRIVRLKMTPQTALNKKVPLRKKGSLNKNNH